MPGAQGDTQAIDCEKMCSHFFIPTLRERHAFIFLTNVSTARFFSILTIARTVVYARSFCRQ